MGVKAQECLFIDNSEKNLTIPKAMGFQAYFHDYEANDIEKLKKFLISLTIKL